MCIRDRTWKGKVVEVVHEIRHVNAALIDASLDRRLAAVVVFNNMLNQLNPVLGSGKCRVKSCRVVSQVQAFCMWAESIEKNISMARIEVAPQVSLAERVRGKL